MRVLAACLTTLIGLSAMVTMAACTDATDDGSGGAGGGSAAGSPSSGGAAAGAHSAGSAGMASGGSAGESAECSFASEKCATCLATKCLKQVGACRADAGCKEALSTLPNCACDPKNTTEDCQAQFVTDGGDTALQFAMCYTLNCTDDCE